MAEYRPSTIVNGGCFAAIIKEIWELDSDSSLWELWVIWDPRAAMRINGVNEYKIRYPTPSRRSEKIGGSFCAC